MNNIFEGIQSHLGFLEAALSTAEKMLSAAIKNEVDTVSNDADNFERLLHIIEKTQKGTADITNYLLWFLDCFERALLASEKNLEVILDKSHFWDKHKFTSINERQRKIINYLYDNYENEVGFLRTSSYAKLANCSTDTALRDLQDLVKKEILKSEDIGKKTNYLIISPKNIRIPKISTKN